MSYSIRQLIAGDEERFRTLRLSGLKSDPEAFGSTFDKEEPWPIARYERMLKNSYVTGVFDGDILIGTAAVFQMNGSSAHRANVWGVIVEEAHRRRGVGVMLMDAVVAFARQHVLQLHLGVGTHNTSALRLYQKAGFEIYGTEPRSLFVNGRYIDEHLMVRLLDKAPGDKND